MWRQDFKVSTLSPCARKQSLLPSMLGVVRKLAYLEVSHRDFFLSSLTLKTLHYLKIGTKFSVGEEIKFHMTSSILPTTKGIYLISLHVPCRWSITLFENRGWQTVAYRLATYFLYDWYSENAFYNFKQLKNSQRKNALWLVKVMRNPGFSVLTLYCNMIHVLSVLLSPYDGTVEWLKLCKLQNWKCSLSRLFQEEFGDPCYRR